MRCQHRTCATINAVSGVRAGVAAAVLQTSTLGHMNLAVGLENAGMYRNQWNVCAGSAEPQEIDQSTGCVCYLNTLRREMEEEFKLPMTWSNFDGVFKQLGHYDYFFIHGTPVFIGHVPDGVRRRDIRAAMQQAMNNPHQFSPAQREMRDFEYCNIGTNRTPEGGHLPLSSFTSAIVRHLLQNGY